MSFEISFKHFFQDFNPSKFVVYLCLFVFTLLFSLRLDDTIQWSYWVVFSPIWAWKMLVIVGAVLGSWSWWNHPTSRADAQSYLQYKAMIISAGLQILLLMFELLACDKLESNRKTVLWIFVIVPLLLLSILSIAICIWSVKHDRSFELELFFSINILQFIFFALRLDGYIDWSWLVVLIPIWIVMCVALIGVLYSVILAIILIKSPEIIPEQRRRNVFSAIGYCCLVIPLLVFQVLLAYKEDGVQDYSYAVVSFPLYFSLFTLMMMSFGAKTSNQWWFGIRRDFCSWFLGICPALQEYGNISYKLPSVHMPESQSIEVESPPRKIVHSSLQKGVVSFVSIEAPD